MTQRIFRILMASMLLFASCKNDENIAPTPAYQLGKNRFTVEVGGDVREFYVHVPSAYDPGQPVPVVFMLHGSSGDGEKFYNISGWKELGEAENILTVFPSSWHYCVIDDGQVKHTTKWNVYPGTFAYCQGETPRDDVGFFHAIIGDLGVKFNIDQTKMYIVGFSNGGQMAGRCAIEMSDVFAAVCENAGGLRPDTVFTPVRNLPVIFQVGNSDDGFTQGSGMDIPMEHFDSLLRVQSYFGRAADTHVNSFQLEPDFMISGNANTALIATYRAAGQAPERVFQFILVKDLEHQYPNGTNHWLHGAVKHWEWMSQFSLE